VIEAPTAIRFTILVAADVARPAGIRRRGTGANRLHCDGEAQHGNRGLFLGHGSPPSGANAARSEEPGLAAGVNEHDISSWPNVCLRTRSIRPDIASGIDRIGAARLGLATGDGLLHGRRGDAVGLAEYWSLASMSCRRGPRHAEMRPGLVEQPADILPDCRAPPT